MPVEGIPSKRPDGSGYRSSKEEEFLAAWESYGFKGSDLCREHRFHPTRKWRWDFAWPSLLTAVEIQGFGYRGSGGGHQSIQGLIRDAEKWREAIALGWVVIPFTSSCLSSKAKRREAVEFVCGVLERRAREDFFGKPSTDEAHYGIEE